MIAPPAFDYTPVQEPEKVQKSVERIRKWSADCDRHAQTTAELAIKIGSELLESKARVPHGLWGHWLRDEFGWSDRTAQKFMAVSRRFKSAPAAHLSVTVLTLLAGESVPEEAVAEVIAVAQAEGGVSQSRTRAIVASHQPNKVSESKSTGRKKSSASGNSQAETKPSEKNRISGEMEHAYGPAPSADCEAEQQSEPIEPTEQEIEQQILELAAKLSPEAKARVYGKLGECAGPDGKPLASLQVLAENPPVVAENAVIVAQKPAFVAPSPEVTLPPAKGELIPFDPLDMKGPEKFDGPRFRKAWSEWVQYNVEECHPLNESVATKQMKELAARSLDAAIAAIDKAIASRAKSFPAAKCTKPPFVPPTVEQVDEYIKSARIPKITGVEFVDFYLERDWKVKGGAKMSDWKAAVRNWHHMDKKREKEKQQATVKGSAAVGGAYEIFKPTRRKSHDGGAPAQARA